MVSQQDIVAAHERIKPYIIRTPILRSGFIDDYAGCSILFKCENLQEIGAFKARGAMNAVLSLSPQERKNGIGTHSSGNHAQAIARAAKLVNEKAYIVMPRTVPDVKRKGVLQYGGTIIDCDNTLQSRESTLAEIVKETNAAVVHPFDNYAVIAGQATAAKELIEDSSSLDIIMAPVGGGGLISGTALAAKYFSPGTQVIAGEPAGADDAYRSMKSGKIELSQSNTIADGLLTSLSQKTFSIIRENVQEIITVSDDEIIRAMQLVWERLKVIIEPSGAVPLAALLKEKKKFAGKRVGIIFSGGNIDLEKAFALFVRQGAVHA